MASLIHDWIDWSFIQFNQYINGFPDVSSNHYNNEFTDVSFNIIKLSGIASFNSISLNSVGFHPIYHWIPWWIPSDISLNSLMDSIQYITGFPDGFHLIYHWIPWCFIKNNQYPISSIFLCGTGLHITVHSCSWFLE